MHLLWDVQEPNKTASFKKICEIWKSNFAFHHSLCPKQMFAIFNLCRSCFSVSCVLSRYRALGLCRGLSGPLHQLRNLRCWGLLYPPWRPLHGCSQQVLKQKDKPHVEQDVLSTSPWWHSCVILQGLSTRFRCLQMDRWLFPAVPEHQHSGGPSLETLHHRWQGENFCRLERSNGEHHVKDNKWAREEKYRWLQEIGLFWETWSDSCTLIAIHCLNYFTLLSTTNGLKK